MPSLSLRLAGALCALALGAVALPAAARDALGVAEQSYADWLDANYALSTLAAGPATVVAGLDRAGWEQRRAAAAAALERRLAALRKGRLDAADRKVLAAMQAGYANPPSAPAASNADQTAARCGSAQDPTLTRAALSAALYACFEHHGNHIRFEDRTLVRTTALELLQELDSGERRRALFTALGPLWSAINADDAPASPYRRLLRLVTADAAAQHGTPIDEAARTVGASRDEIERWLVAILSAWAQATEGSSVEPWNYWHAHTAASRSLDALIPPERILELDRAYYRDLGADLDLLGVTHDFAVRDGKAPLAYSDLVRIGRIVDGRWRPPLARVSANVEHGGLYVLNEIVHEDGHSVQVSSIRTRPAFFGWGDDLYVEAFADSTSWSVAEPAWQQRYLGRSTPVADSLRALYASVMLDAAWGLFELRLLRDPQLDPNAVWTDITSRYLHVIPHPDLSWWALRVQLVDLPGYMINYGLGAVLTAEIRSRTRAAIGDYDAGNPRWHAWTSRHLLRFGTSVPTPVLLRRFLGHPVSPQPLLLQLARLDRARS